MTAIRIATSFAVLTVLIWTVKALVIWNAGGLNKSDLEGPLFVLGLVSYLVAAGAIGMHLLRRRGLVLRAVGALLGAIGGLAVVMLFDTLADVLPKDTGWVREEAGLWVAAIVLALVAFALRRRSDDGAVVAAPATAS